MRLIDRRQNEKVVRYLSIDEAAAIRRFCGRKGMPQPSDESTVLAVLNEMRDGREVVAWLECDCRTGVSSENTNPRLTAQCRESGTTFFRRLTNYGEHLCELKSFRVKPDYEDSDDRSSATHQPIEPILDPLDFLEQERSNRTKHPTGNNDGNAAQDRRGKRLPRLARILSTILAECGFDVVATASGTRPWEKITEFSSEESMTPDLNLDKILFTKPWLNPTDIMAKIENIPWPVGKRRSALLLFIADEIKDGKAYANYKFGEVVVSPAKKIRISGRDQKYSKPPFWILAVIDRDVKGVARVREAFAQHAYTRFCPVPLDSNAERHTLNILLGKLGWNGLPKDAQVVIRKPLFDLVLSQSGCKKEACRPDFEIDIRDKTDAAYSPIRARAVIETMGSKSEEYLTGKGYSHAIMRDRGTIIKHEVCEEIDQVAADETFRKRLYALAMRSLDKR